MESIAIFVDVQNIYYTVKEKYGRHFNYNTFWASATHNRRVEKAIAYAIDRGDEKQMRFQQILRNIGFEVKLKQFIKREDGSTKGDWDVGITVDMLDYARNVDVIILASGDGDFEIVIDRIKNKYGRAVEVYGVPDLTAHALIEACTRFFPVNERFLM